MPESNPTALEQIPATGDPGDETGSRYEYQYIYAAIVSCSLLDETAGMEAVLCEHHEDIVVRLSDGHYRALQIKTRATDQPVWKTSDDGFRKSCKRFAQLENSFPSTFRDYRFLTNHPLHAVENGQGIKYVLREIREADSIDHLAAPVSSFVGRVTSDSGVDREVVFAAMRKTAAFDNLPKGRDIRSRLIETIVDLWPQAEDAPLGRIRVAADRLVAACREASCLAHEQVLPAYLEALDNPPGEELAARLDSKRIDTQLVTETLSEGASQTAPLHSNPDTAKKPAGGTSELLAHKLEAGGFSAVSQNSAEDLRDKSDYLALAWTQRYGRSEGLGRYDHVRSLVLSDAATAFESTKNAGDPFGPAMLKALRERIKTRRSDGSTLYDCSDEHLEGVSYALTSECEVAWSNDRPWEDE